MFIDGAHWCYQKDPTKALCLLVNQDNNNAQEFYKSLGAYNAKISCWNAPDGSVVPTYWFVWDNLNWVENHLKVH